MVLYFADRRMNILGLATTELQMGISVTDDLKSEDIDTGTVTFECYLPYTDDTRSSVTACTAVGNYLLRSANGENEFYTIIESREDTKTQEVYVYAEDAGMDLLNEIAPAFAAEEAHPIAWYVEKYTKDSGFVIGLNEIPDYERTLSWDGEATCAARLASVATQFDNAEISYSFEIKGLTVTNKYVNIHAKRGQDAGVQLRLNREIDRIVTKTSIANLCTALLVTGGTPEAEGDEEPQAITLAGYEYDDGDIYVTPEGQLNSREAVKIWSRYVNPNEPNLEEDVGHIVGTYSYDTTSQSELCNRAITKLKTLREPEVNYEIELKTLPDNVRIGDTVYIVDDAGELYLSSRILELTTSVCNQKQTATLGEFLIKDSGIAAQVQELADAYSKLAKSRTYYTWIVYADTSAGDGISLLPDGKAYIGISANHLSAVADLSDPTIYKWSLIKGDEGVEIESYEIEYALSESGSEVPTSGWDTSFPEIDPESTTTQYLWTRMTVTYTDGTRVQTYSVGYIGADGTIGILSGKVDENTDVIEQIEDAIKDFCKEILDDEDYEENKDDLTALFAVTAGIILAKFNSLWITESEEGIRIGREGSTMQSLQDNDSYEFIETATDSTVVTLDASGLTSTRVGAQQVELLNEDGKKQWVLRHGRDISDVGYGLDIVWVG